MRWSPDIVGQWIARVPADHAWRTITRADEMKLMRWVWRSGGMKFVVGENGINPEKNLPRPCFVHHEPHMEWPRRELGTPEVGGERLTACATRPPIGGMKYVIYFTVWTVPQKNNNAHLCPVITFLLSSRQTFSNNLTKIMKQHTMKTYWRNKKTFSLLFTIVFWP